MAERSRYQEQIIRNYYKHQDTLRLSRLQELVTELYLAEGKARARRWKQAEAAMRKLDVPESRIAHLVKSGDPQLLAGLVEELLGREASGDSRKNKQGKGRA